jgi:hypothetical protein
VVAGVEAALDTRMVQGAGDGDLPAIAGQRCRIAEEELRVGALEHDGGTRSESMARYTSAQPPTPSNSSIR